MGNNLVCRRICRRWCNSGDAASIIGKCTYEEDKHSSTKFYVSVITSNARTGENSIRMTTHDRRDIAGLQVLQERLYDLPDKIHGRDKTLEYVRGHIQHCEQHSTMRFW